MAYNGLYWLIMAIFVMKFVIEDMTETQRIARVEFVKKLLVANGFSKSGKTRYYKFDTTDVSEYYTVKILKHKIYFDNGYITDIPIVITHEQFLKPLRDFIKLSNQKQHEND